MYDTILLATDGTVASRDAESHAISLAQSHDATLHALSVTEDSLLGEAADNTAAEEAIEAVEEAAAERGVDDVETHIEAGTPDEVILSYVEDHDLDAEIIEDTSLDRLSNIKFVSLGDVSESIGANVTW